MSKKTLEELRTEREMLEKKIKRYHFYLKGLQERYCEVDIEIKKKEMKLDE